MAIIVANAASTYTAAASVPNSSNRWAWIGLMPPANASGSATWWMGTAASAGSPLMVFVSPSSAHTPPLAGPFNSPTGFFAASISANASAVIWLKSGSGV